VICSHGHVVLKLRVCSCDWGARVPLATVGVEGALAFVTSFFLVVRWPLSCEDTWNERRRRGGWPGAKEVWLDAHANHCISQVALHI